MEHDEVPQLLHQIKEELASIKEAAYLANLIAYRDSGGFRSSDLLDVNEQIRKALGLPE